MAIERKKIEKIYLIITLIIVLAIIAIVVLFVVKPKKIDETNINLVDNTFIKDKFEETNYEIFHIDMQYQARGAKVDFYDYKSEYINIITGENNSIEYKNVIRSVLKKNVSKASVEEIENSMNEYKKKALEYLNYTNLELTSEYDRTKDGNGEVDTSKTTYENIKDGSTVHYITLFEERLNYEIAFYVKDDILYGEIAYYIPTTNESNPDVKVDPNDPSQKQGVG